MLVDGTRQVDHSCVEGRFFHHVLPVEVTDGGHVIAMDIIAGHAHDACFFRAGDREPGFCEPEDIRVAIEDRSRFRLCCYCEQLACIDIDPGVVHDGLTAFFQVEGGTVFPGFYFEG